jgi:mannose-6-phosphate isomerase-like protein (cupin superfamily)
MTMIGLLEGLCRLTEEAGLYLDLMGLEDDEIRIEVSLVDSDEAATLVVGRGIEVLGSSEDPDLRLTMERRVFDDMMEGDADFGAMVGRSRMSDVRPVNVEMLKADKASSAMEVLKTMMTIFFTPGKVKVKRLRKELAGEAHGAHPIPLVYYDDLRCAWYAIKKGEVLNEAGERDPYPQAIVVLKGEGVIVVGDERLELEPQTVVYIPKNALHQIEASEDVEALWLAWQAPP